MIYNINFDDYSSTETGDDPNDADGSCAANATTYVRSWVVQGVQAVKTENVKPVITHIPEQG